MEIFQNFVAFSEYMNFNISWFCFDVSWCCIENDHNFKRNEDYATVFLKWTGFICMYLFLLINWGHQISKEIKLDFPMESVVFPLENKWINITETFMCRNTDYIMFHFYLSLHKRARKKICEFALIERPKWLWNNPRIQH